MTNQNSMAQFLQQLDQEFQAAEVQDYSQIPDGTYTAKVEVARLTESKSGKPMIEFEFVITEGQFQSRKEWKYHVLEAGRMQFLKFDLVAMGAELENLPQLLSVLPTLLDKVVELNIKTKKGKDGNDYRNLYVNKSKQDPFAPNASNGKSANGSTLDLPF